ncbi:MAG: CDC27 family protein [Campylobacterales bacterium]|nr:CDC27 family protein [Campylobacterales bacterium]
MYDMKELEKKWFKYKVIQSIPWFVAVIAVVLMIVYYNNRVTVNSIVAKYYEQTMQTYFPKKIETNTTVIVEVNTTKVTTNEVEKNVTHELNVSDEIFETNDTIYESNDTSNPFFSSIKDAPKVIDDKTPHEKLEDEIEKRHEKKYVYIKKSSSAYKEVEQRFATSQDPEDALFLARVYFEMKQYQKAEEWAFIANELNDNSEESWLIYAKAKAVRGEYQKAIHILDSYLKKTNSIQARKLLEEYKVKLSKK